MTSQGDRAGDGLLHVCASGKQSIMPPRLRSRLCFYLHFHWGEKKERHVGDKKATGSLSPILIPNHSQYKAPQPRRAASEGIPAGLTSYLPAKIPPPQTGSHCWEGGAREADGLPLPEATHSLPADKGSGGFGSGLSHHCSSRVLPD